MGWCAARRCELAINKFFGVIMRPMDSIQFSDLKEFLSDCIKLIKKSHPNLSSAQLAKNSI